MPSLKIAHFLSQPDYLVAFLRRLFYLGGKPLASQHHHNVFQQEIVKRFPFAAEKEAIANNLANVSFLRSDRDRLLAKAAFSAPRLFSLQFINGFLSVMVGDASGLHNAVREHEAVHFRKFDLRRVLMCFNIEPGDRRQKLKELFACAARIRAIGEIICLPETRELTRPINRNGAWHDLVLAFCSWSYIQLTKLTSNYTACATIKASNFKKRFARG